MISDFIVDRMSSYLVGGMKPKTAARFTMGELGAIYRGTHYSRDNSGAMRLTLLPEDIPMEAAKVKGNEAIKEILKCYTEDAKREAKAPEKNGISGFEKMAEYARNPV
jgi:hypothetical protein